MRVVAAPAAMYSTRKLVSTYAGSAIRVRRSSDNTEQNIGFVGNALDTASLVTFVGANSGYITKWYDQSGNGADAVQETQGNQPRIRNAGTTDIKNTLPSIYFSGTSGVNLATASSAISTLSQVIAVQSPESGTASLAGIWGLVGSDFGLRFLSSTNYNAPGTSADFAYGSDGYIRNNGTQYTYPSGATASQGTLSTVAAAIGSGSTNFSAGLAIGGYVSSLYMKGYISELIAYSSTQSTTDTAAIEAFMKTYFATP